MTKPTEDGLREQILEALLGADADSEELYVDTKAKFLIDDLVPLFKAHSLQERIDELYEANVDRNDAETFKRRIKQLEGQVAVPSASSVAKSNDD